MGTPTRSALVRLFKETKGVLETQVSTLRSLDEKSAQLLRFNVLVSGIVVTAVSILLREGIPSGALAWPALSLITVGFAALVASTVLALVAHRAEGYRIGIRSEGLVEAMKYETTEEQFLAAAIRSYHEGIAANRRLRDRSVTRLQWASWLLLAAVISLGGASIGLLAGTVP